MHPKVFTYPTMHMRMRMRLYRAETIALYFAWLDYYTFLLMVRACMQLSVCMRACAYVVLC